MTKKSNRKGAAFERWCGQKLSLWLTGGKDRTQLIRSVMSGGWAAGREHGRHVGDLAPNGPAGQRFCDFFATECKHYRVINVWPLLDPKARVDKTILTWWEKILHEANAAGLHPLLIFRGNAMPPLAMLSSGTLEYMTIDGWAFSSVETEVNVKWLGATLVPLAEILACSPSWLIGE